MIEHPEIGKLEYNQITKHVYIGTNACYRPHFDRELLKKGVEADISLEEEKLDTPYGVRFFLWLPVKNHTAPLQEQLDFGVAALEKLAAMKKKIYVHCQNGHGRAPTLVAAYLIKKGKTVRQAIEFIKSKRPAIHLDKVQLESLNKFKKGRINLYL